jgi:transcriptional regulator GlxA family with amidase domain
VAAGSQRTTIGLLLYPGLTALDLVGPLQVFAGLEALDPRFQVVVVGPTSEPVATDVPVRLAASRSFDELPAPDVVVVPGGRLPTIRAMSDPAIRSWIQAAAPTARLMTSVCTGSLILAASGVLGQGPASTNWFFSGVLERLGVPYRHARWVDNGQVITAAGVSAGIDMALYVVSLLTDTTTAKRVQAVIDYDPAPPAGGIDWQHVPLPARALRALIRTASPILTWQARRLRAADRRRPSTFDATPTSR